MSKGDKYRPVKYDKWSDNYDRIFTKTITNESKENTIQENSNERQRRKELQPNT